MTATAALMCVVLGPLAGYAQTATVRVTAPELTIRSSPDPRSTVVATVKAGTLLDMVARRGDWVEVRLPPLPAGSARQGFVPTDHVEDFPVRSGDATVGQSGLSAARPSAGTVSADWQVRYDRAVDKRRAGRRKQNIGGAIALVGGVMNVYGLLKGARAAEDEQQRHLTIAYVGVGTGLTGAFIGYRGTTDMRAATREMMLLDAEREAAGAPRRVSFTTGRGARVAVTFTW